MSLLRHKINGKVYYRGYKTEEQRQYEAFYQKKKTIWSRTSTYMNLAKLSWALGINKIFGLLLEDILANNPILKSNVDVELTYANVNLNPFTTKRGICYCVDPSRFFFSLKTICCPQTYIRWMLRQETKFEYSWGHFISELSIFTVMKWASYMSAYSFKYTYDLLSY